MENERLPRIRVAALIVEDGRVLLVRHEKAERSYWLLPGGGVDYGESLPEALVRELREEVRVEVTPGPLSLVSETIAEDGSRHTVQMVFRAEIRAGKPILGEDPRVVEVAFIPLEELPSLVLHPPANAAVAALAAGEEWIGYGGVLWRA